MKKSATKQLPEISMAIRRLRDHLGDSQERFSRRVGVALMTINRFETGKAEPREPYILKTLATIAHEANMELERDLFFEAQKESERVRNIKNHYLPSYTGMGTVTAGIGAYSLVQWRLMAAARTACMYFPETVAAIEKAAGPAMELVDEVLSTSEYVDPMNYSGLDFDIHSLGERRTLEALKQEKNK